jgi:hypothetical protein
MSINKGRMNFHLLQWNYLQLELIFNLPAYLCLDQTQDIKISHQLLAKSKVYHLIHYGCGPPRSKIGKMATEFNALHHAPFNRFLQCWFKWPPPLLIISFAYNTEGQLHLCILSLHFETSMQNLPPPLTIVLSGFIIILANSTVMHLYSFKVTIYIHTKCY